MSSQEQPSASLIDTPETLSPAEPPLEQLFALLSTGIDAVFAALDLNALKLFALKIDSDFFSVDQRQYFKEFAQGTATKMLEGNVLSEMQMATALQNYVARLADPDTGLNQTMYLAKILVLIYNGLSRQLHLKLEKTPTPLFKGISGTVASEIDELRQQWQQQHNAIDPATDDTDNSSKKRKIKEDMPAEPTDTEPETAQPDSLGPETTELETAKERKIEDVLPAETTAE